MWIARDIQGMLWLFKNKPEKVPEAGAFASEIIGDLYGIDDNLFPEVQYENSPKELVIKEIKS